MKLAVIGAGPAGMISAIYASKKGEDVYIFDKNALPKKLLITGKGRCNITNDTDMSNFFKNIVRNEKFMYTAFSKYTNRDILNLLNKNGVDVKVERGGRIFPKSDKSIDVVNALKREIKNGNIKEILGSKVIDIQKEEEKFKIVLEGKDRIFLVDRCIIATGGLSYPLTGSTGDGYEFAKKFGHSIIKAYPSLVPFKTYSKEKYSSLMGLSLKNANFTLVIEGKKVHEEFGEGLFTHFGISGPSILRISSYIYTSVKKMYKLKEDEDIYRKIKGLFNEKKIYISIDLKPAITEKQLDQRLLREFDQNINKKICNVMENLLPKSMIKVFLDICEIKEEKRANEITKEDRKKILFKLKNFDIYLKDFESFDMAIITKGGINTKEINPKTMESRICKGLYFAGEIIDVDALTGGFNLQIAYSTGYLAGTKGE